MACNESTTDDTGSLANTSNSRSHYWFPPDNSYCSNESIASNYTIELDTSGRDYPEPYDEVGDWTRVWLKSIFTESPSALIDKEECNPSSKCSYDGCTEPSVSNVEYWVEQLDINDGYESAYYDLTEPVPTDSGDPEGDGDDILQTGISLAANTLGGAYGSIAAAAIQSYFDTYDSGAVTQNKSQNDNKYSLYWDIGMHGNGSGLETVPAEPCESTGVQFRIDNATGDSSASVALEFATRYEIIYPIYPDYDCRCEWDGVTYTVKTTPKTTDTAFLELQ